MTMTDPIADMLTRIRNGLSSKKEYVEMPASTVKSAILNVLVSEGYVLSFEEFEKDGFKNLRVKLKYYDGKPVISEIARLSKPGIRKYSSVDDIPSVRGGLGITVVSTSKGIMADHKARELGIGGELLAYVF